MNFRTFVADGSIFSPSSLSSSSSTSLLLLIFVVVVNCLSAVKCYETEYYSSVAGLESLLKTEQILVADLKDYVQTLKQQIVILEK